jgi:hypothetical protein
MPRLVRISAGILVAAATPFLARAQTFSSVATFTLFGIFVRASSTSKRRKTRLQGTSASQ